MLGGGHSVVGIGWWVVSGGHSVVGIGCWVMGIQWWVLGGGWWVVGGGRWVAGDRSRWEPRRRRILLFLLLRSLFCQMLLHFTDVKDPFGFLLLMIWCILFLSPTENGPQYVSRKASHIQSHVGQPKQQSVLDRVVVMSKWQISFL